MSPPKARTYEGACGEDTILIESWMLLCACSPAHSSRYQEALRLTLADGVVHHSGSGR